MRLADHERPIGTDEVQGHVRIAAEAEAELGLPDELGADVDPSVLQQSRGVGVVHAGVALLRLSASQSRARRQEELGDVNVRREPVSALIGGVVRRLIGAEGAVEDRAEKATAQAGANGGPLQGERGQDVELERAILLGAPVQGVGDPHRLSQPEGETEGHPLADSGDERVGERVGVSVSRGCGHDSWCIPSALLPAAPRRSRGAAHRRRPMLSAGCAAASL